MRSFQEASKQLCSYTKIVFPSVPSAVVQRSLKIEISPPAFLSTIALSEA